MQVDPVIANQENYSTYQYGWNNPILRSDRNEDCPPCDDGVDGIGNGMSLVENIYWSTKDALVSSITTVGTFLSSLVSDTKTQRVNANYENGKRTLSTEGVPEGEVAKEVATSALVLVTNIKIRQPFGG